MYITIFLNFDASDTPFKHKIMIFKREFLKEMIKIGINSHEYENLIILL